MQLHLELGGGGRADVVHLRDRLVEAFGPAQPHVRRDPVAQLVRSVIASRTQDAVSDEVLARLRAAFRPLGRIGEARTEEVLAVIAPATHAERKAPQLIEAIRRIGRLRGAVTLDFLEGWAPDDAMVWLEELPGAGQKVAASVLNLSTLRRRVMVVDTHVWRVATRTGLAAEDADPAEVRLTVMDLAPDTWEPEDFSDLHKLMKRLGRLHCHRVTPECPTCPLLHGCPEGARRFDPRACASPPRARPIGPAPSAGPQAANENAGPGSSDAAWDAYLRRRIARIEARGHRPQGDAVAPVAFGAPELDAAFGGRGLPPGAHQVAPAEPQDHAAPLILPLMAASRMPASGVKLLIVQERAAAREDGELYAPGLEALGVAPAETAFVRVAEGAEVLRVTDEAVRRRAAPVVLAELRRGAGLADLAATRRLNLAAQRRGAFLFLMTPDLLSTSAALTRWRVASAPSQGPPGRLGPPAFRLSLVRNRLGPAGEWACQWSARERRFTSAVPLDACRLDAAIPDAASLGSASLGSASLGAARLGAAMAAPLGAAPVHRPAAAGAT